MKMAEHVEKVDFHAATLEQLRECGLGNKKGQAVLDAIAERLARQPPRPFISWRSIEDACKGVGENKVLYTYMLVTHQTGKQFSANRF